jgi:ABC-2 type transport system permease protein
MTDCSRRLISSHLSMFNYFSFHRFFGLSLHYLYSMKRNPARIIEMLVWPSLELILFSLLAVSIRSADSRAETIGLGILSGVVFWNFTARIIQESVSQFLDDAFSRNLQNLLITPFSLLELVLSIIWVSFIKMFLSFALLSIILIVFYPWFFWQVGIQGLFWVVQLLYFGGVLSILALSFVFLFGERLSFIGWFLSMGIQIFSCVFYDRSTLPNIFYWASFLVPSSYVFQSIRMFLQNDKTYNSQSYIAIVLATFYLFVFLIAFKLSFEHARKHGVLTKI